MINAADHIGLVFKLAKRYRGKRSTFSFQDLIQEGCAGLTIAAQKYDPKFNTTFASYAQWWITAYIRRFVAQNLPVVRMPIKAYRKALSEGELPTRISLDKDITGLPGSTAAERNRDGVRTWYDLIASAQPTPEEAAIKSDLLETVRAEVRRLPPKMRLAVRMRFEEDAELRDIGVAIGASHETARQTLFRAFEILRSRLEPDTQDRRAYSETVWTEAA